ncbi:MAG: cysteine synthase A [Spirochaetaceae bacterium]
MIYNSVIDLVGNTPVVKLNKVTEGLKGEVYVKLEGSNPLSSVKDRIAKQMILDAEARGDIDKDTLLIEATSGNTGIGLAFVGAARGYKVAIVMPDTMSLERRKLLKALGAELILTPGAQGMKGAIEKAEEISRENKKSYVLRQFENPSNPEAHRLTTSLEIIKDFPDGLDAFVSGIGTGGTITGTSEVLKKKWPNIHIAAVEPVGSAVLSGESAGPHKIQGIGAGFVPAVLNTDIYDEVIQISSEDSGITSRRVAKEEGLLLGISSGAAVKAALELAARDEYAGKKILAISPSSGERYLSTWLYED